MVYVSQRNTSIASYLSSIRELRKVTIRTIKKFLVSYRYSITNNMLQLAQSLGITINDKKNKITPFKHHSFKFLKIHFTLTETGKVVMKINTAVTRLMRRKLRSFRQWVSTGRMAAEEVFQSYQSYRAHLKRCNSYRTFNRMDKFLIQLFKKELAIREKRFPCTLQAYTNNNRWVYIYS